MTKRKGSRRREKKMEDGRNRIRNKKYQKVEDKWDLWLWTSKEQINYFLWKLHLIFFLRYNSQPWFSKLLLFSMSEKRKKALFKISKQKYQSGENGCKRMILWKEHCHLATCNNIWLITAKECEYFELKHLNNCSDKC